jgi:hypothetical protein
MTEAKGYEIREYDTHCSVDDHNGHCVFVADTREDALFWIRRVEHLTASSLPNGDRQ